MELFPNTHIGFERIRLMFLSSRLTLRNRKQALNVLQFGFKRFPFLNLSAQDIHVRRDDIVFNALAVICVSVVEILFPSNFLRGHRAGRQGRYLTFEIRNALKNLHLLHVNTSDFYVIPIIPPIIQQSRGITC